MSAAEVLPSDPALPNLASLFDLEQMGRLLAQNFAGQSGPMSAVAGPIHCEIERVKYRPRRNCVVGYRVRWPDGRTARPAWQRAVVAMYPQDEARERGARAAADPTGNPELVRVDTDLGSLLWRFPRDRKLPSLPLLSDQGVVRQQWLAQLAAATWPDTPHIVSARAQVVSYFPEHGCTVQARVRLGDASGRVRRVWVVFGKARYDDAGAQTERIMRALQASDAARDGAVGFARPLGFDAAHRVHWQEGVRAPTLDRVLISKEPPERTWTQVARAVAALHRTPLALPARLTGELIVAEIERAQQIVALACPDAAVALQAVVARLLATRRNRDFATVGTTHGDLHSKNILLSPRRVYLIDLDRVAAGVPNAELGSLLAEEAYRTCLADVSPDIAKLEQIARAYAHEVPWAVEAEDVRWHIAAALIRERAYRCVTSLKPGRLGSLPRVIDAARACLERVA